MEEINDQTRWLSEQAPKLILFARQWVSCHADAEDVFHTAFVRFWQQRDRVRDPIPFLYTCVRREAANCAANEADERNASAPSIHNRSLRLTKTD